MSDQNAVATATGTIPASNLGATSMHEHVFTLNAELRDNYPWDEERVVAAAVSQLSDLRARGISTIVDLTVYGLGRDLPRVARISCESGMQIVVATGIYTFRDLPTYFRLNEMVSPGFIADFFVREVEEGIGGVHPAIFKLATDTHGVTEDVETVIRAVARAHRRTGVPISTHAHAATRQGLAQQHILDEEGVDLRRVVIGHVGDVADLDYAEAVLTRGSFIGLDRFGISIDGMHAEAAAPVDGRIAIAVELCRRGYASQLVMGHDTNVESDSVTRKQRAQMPGLRDWHFTYISDVVVPAMRAGGVTQAEIDQILIDNPRRILAHGGAY
ncbi:MAG: phosphotriesterase [Candidatus Saccharibacteria bacterium]|nr:phosphotriesterase [Microbacteriaceae bacterium]